MTSTGQTREVEAIGLSAEAWVIYAKHYGYPVWPDVPAGSTLVPLKNVKLRSISCEEGVDQDGEIVRRWTQLLER